jgi:2-desacetyl-2-hydroxyethyl bacteriochlorophyllide A dehydrogenase
MDRRTIVFTGKEQLELVREPLREPHAGELLVATTRSVISTGTEGIVFTRRFAPGTHWDNWVKYPFRPGYLSAGRVIAVGDGVTGWNVGDRVASRGGHSSHAYLKVAATPGVAQFARIPDNVSDEDAAWMGLGKIVQVGVRAAEHTMGDAVAVVGLGLLGQLVVQYCRLMGAGEVIAIDTAPLRLEMAASHGATRTLRMTAAEALGPVTEITGGRRADVVYDVTGHHAVFATALPLARRFGTVVVLGDTGSPQQQTLTSDVITRGLRIVGAHDGHPPTEPSDHVRWTHGLMGELFLTYLSRGQIRLNDLATHRYKPEQAAECYAMLHRERDRAMGVVFEWQ